MMKYTKFTGIEADEVKGDVKGDVKGGLLGAVTLSKSADYALSAAEKSAPAVVCTMSAASKKLTLGLAAGQMMFVINNGGTNAFTLCSRNGDTGTSLGTGKTALVIGSGTANASIIKVLD